MNQTDLSQNSSPNPSQNPRIAFIKARWHGDIVDRCQAGFQAELARLGREDAALEVFAVPGSLEIPLMAKRLAMSGRFDAIVAAGFVVDGGIYRYEFVAGTVIDALMRVQLESGVPILSAVLSPHHFHEHEAHRDFFAAHFVTKGKEAAGACLDMLGALARLERESAAA